jgi:hypothetical protein
MVYVEETRLSKQNAFWLMLVPAVTFKRPTPLPRAVRRLLQLVSRHKQLKTLSSQWASLMKLGGMVRGPYSFCKAERNMALRPSKLRGRFTLTFDIYGT